MTSPAFTCTIVSSSIMSISADRITATTFRLRKQQAYESRAGLLLRARRERPRGCRAAQQRDELAPSHHSITSSARASQVVGTSIPGVLAVCVLITNSNFVGGFTGIAVGFAPLRMRPA